MTPAQMAALLRELHALELAQAVIDARQDSANAFTWQCVAAAIRDRRATLIALAERRLIETSSADLIDETTPSPVLTADGPPGLVH